MLNERLYFCWYCFAEATDVPAWWGAPWLIEAAHIVNKPRLEDPRVVVNLCSLCHKKQHGYIFKLDRRGRIKLAIAHMLWLKQFWDEANYDRVFMQRCAIQSLPRAICPWTSKERELAAYLRSINLS